MRVQEEPVLIDLFRQNPVFTSLHLKTPVHVVPPLGGKNWILPKNNKCKLVLLRLPLAGNWKNHLHPSVGLNGGSLAMYSVFTSLHLRSPEGHNRKSQMHGGKNWILPKEMNANQFFQDAHWLEIWKCPLWD
jgi:hypothetical protein